MSGTGPDTPDSVMKKGHGSCPQDAHVLLGGGVRADKSPAATATAHE